MTVLRFLAMLALAGLAGLGIGSAVHTLADLPEDPRGFTAASFVLGAAAFLIEEITA